MNPSRRLSVPFPSAVAVAALLLAPLAAEARQPATLRVGAGGRYPTPAAALADARPGDTVRVEAGVYRGVLVVDRAVVLVGETGAVLDGGGAGTVVAIAADSVELRGFVIRNGGTSLDRDDAAVKLERCTGCRVVDNRIEDAAHGIYLLESHGTTIAGNTITGNLSLREARRGNGVHLFHSTGNRIERNVIRSTRDGIYFSFSSGNEVAGNDVARVRYGLHYMYSDDNRFLGNRFHRNAAGAAIMFSKRIVLRENVFSDHVGYRAYGILLQTSERIVAERNRIEGNLVGLFLDNSTGNLFRRNAIVGNGTGVDLLTSAEANTFTENVFLHNRVSVRSAVGGGENTWAMDGRGNYWGARDVFDLDGDGIGDRPYQASDPFATLAALRPVLEIFSGTPAAMALSWAERAFPVFGLPTVTDPAPLVHPPDVAPIAVAKEDEG